LIQVRKLGEIVVGPWGLAGPLAIKDVENHQLANEDGFLVPGKRSRQVVLDRRPFAGAPGLFKAVAGGIDKGCRLGREVIKGVGRADVHDRSQADAGSVMPPIVEHAPPYRLTMFPCRQRTSPLSSKIA
jgi:hypothetical protein